MSLFVLAFPQVIEMTEPDVCIGILKMTHFQLKSSWFSAKLLLIVELVLSSFFLYGTLFCVLCVQIFHNALPIKHFSE